MLLEPIPTIPVAFCKDVYLNSKRFVPDIPMHIQLTVTWRNETFKEGSAAWSENVTTNGFRTCVLVAGRHFSGGVPIPTVFWMAYQRSLIIPSNGQLLGGSVVMNTWYSGSRCLRLPGVYGSTVKMIFSVNHCIYIGFLYLSKGLSYFLLKIAVKKFFIWCFWIFNLNNLVPLRVIAKSKRFP